MILQKEFYDEIRLIYPRVYKACIQVMEMTAEHSRHPCWIGIFYRDDFIIYITTGEILNWPYQRIAMKHNLKLVVTWKQQMIKLGYQP